jgi:dTDP-4-dehydrorhamnose reductase
MALRVTLSHPKCGSVDNWRLRDIADVSDSQKTTTWLVTGASGLLGHALCNYLAGSGGRRVVGISKAHPVDVQGIEEVRMDLTAPGTLGAAILRHRPDVVVHAAGLTSVDQCEENEALANRLHVGLSREMAKACAETSAKPVLISTDHLWDGSKPLVAEDEPVKPINAYGRTKAQGEIAALENDPDALVVRTNFFGHGRPWRQSLSDWIISRLDRNQPVRAFADVFFTPISLPYLCRSIEALVTKEVSGIFHVAGADRVSKLAFAQKVAEEFRGSSSLIEAGEVGDAGLQAPRPKDMSLSTAKVSALLGHPMPKLSESISGLEKPARNVA